MRPRKDDQFTSTVGEPATVYFIRARVGPHIPYRDTEAPTGGAVAWVVFVWWAMTVVFAFLLGRWS